MSERKAYVCAPKTGHDLVRIFLLPGESEAKCPRCGRKMERQENAVYRKPVVGKRNRALHS